MKTNWPEIANVLLVAFNGLEPKSSDQILAIRVSFCEQAELDAHFPLEPKGIAVTFDDPAGQDAQAYSIYHDFNNRLFRILTNQEWDFFAPPPIEPPIITV